MSANTILEYCGQQPCRKTISELVAQRDELLKAAKGVWKLLEDGILVRQTNRDHESDWAIKQIPIVRTLAALEVAIADCEKP